MRVTSLLKRRSPSASPLRDIIDMSKGNNHTYLPVTTNDATGSSSSSYDNDDNNHTSNINNATGAPGTSIGIGIGINVGAHNRTSKRPLPLSSSSISLTSMSVPLVPLALSSSSSNASNHEQYNDEYDSSNKVSKPPKYNTQIDSNHYTLQNIVPLIRHYYNTSTSSSSSIPSVTSPSTLSSAILHHQHQHQHQQMQYPKHYQQPITYNLRYYIGRYIQIFTLLFTVHIILVSIYNHVNVPDTCQVAHLSVEKLKLLDWIGRDVDYIIHDSEFGGSGDIDIEIQNGTDHRISNNYDEEEANNSDNNRVEEGKEEGSNKKSVYENSNKKEFVPQLPKIIHHQWKNSNVPPKYTQWYNQWKIHFPQPEYEHILWTDESMRNLIKDHYNWFLETYDNYDLNIKRADASRYFILHYMGGIYADLDYEPMTNFYNYLPQNQVGLVESPYVYNEKTQNSFMTSPKGDPFWIHVFQGLGTHADKSVLHATGPSFLDGMTDTTKHPVYTLPCENFHRIPYGEMRQSRWSAVLGREVLTRIVPMGKHCGYFKEEDSCQFGKHHNAAGWTSEKSSGA